MSRSVFYYCICACLRRCRSFNPSLCHLLPFHLSYVAVSRPCRLSEFTLAVDTVEALVGDHLWNSEKWSQLELVENGLS